MFTKAQESTGQNNDQNEANSLGEEDSHIEVAPLALPIGDEPHYTRDYAREDIDRYCQQIGSCGRVTCADMRYDLSPRNDVSYRAVIRTMSMDERKVSRVAAYLIDNGRKEKRECIQWHVAATVDEHCNGPSQ